MGLQERRAAQTAREEWLPKRSSELEEISGAEITYEIDWDSFDGDLKGLEWLEHNGPHQVSMALRGICADAIGKEAVRSSLQKIFIQNVTDPAEKSVSYETGVLTLRGAFAQSPRGRLDHREIQSCLETSL